MNRDPHYFDRAASWAGTVQTEAARSQRLAWIVAGTAAGLAFFEAVALALLVPLKTVQPITLLVDRHTGYVQALDPQSPRRVVADDALTQSFLAQYVTAREGFDRATLAANYRKVAMLSAGPARSTYLAAMPASNPTSPLNQYPPGTIVSAVVKSVSKLDPGAALVRFDTQQQERSGRLSQPQPWISVIRYRYVDAPMSVEDRLVNPLGFQVLTYRRDAEAPVAERLSVPASATPVVAVSRPAPAPIPVNGLQAVGPVARTGQ
ncbi:virB8 family protein [Sphingomonas sp. GCM10030256]|uniref:virB8 family protein n=1 Tax=Sphingomonas sp. GCM10030256 TaxID=3273427 RepID=UPI003615DE05